METTFITIHDLSPEARILYTSDSIVDILGYSPEEVVNRPTWEFFHHEELPFARAKHGKGVEMDKAAVLSYCRLRDKDGRWLGCEVVFTVVYDVMVGCTSIYRRGMKSHSRALEAPAVRRLFSSSPRDPRYHMLSHLSTKFALPPIHGNHEARAALFLNRYTRSLTIMYATDGLANVLGITGDEMKGKSFYYCIEENCLQDAIRCLENAKANDSIAYLRFWYRDPRQENVGNWQDENQDNLMDTEDDEMEDVASVEEESVGGEEMVNDPNLASHSDRHRDQSHETVESGVVSSTDSVEPMDRPRTDGAKVPLPHDESGTSSGRSSNPFSHEAVFGEPDQNQSSVSSMSNSPRDVHSGFQPRWRNNERRQPIELEAVVSCTSDGLVVCLRRARPAIPRDKKPNPSATEPVYANGLFAAPWGTEPIIPPAEEQPLYLDRPQALSALAPGVPYPSPISPPNKRGSDDFMHAIRDIVVFAWALTGINGSLAQYGHGKPRGESQPASGLPIWQPEAQQHNPIGDGVSHAKASQDCMSGSDTVIETEWNHERRIVGGTDIEMVGSPGQMVDGVGHGRSRSRSSHQGSENHRNKINSKSPETNHSNSSGRDRDGYSRSFYGSETSPHTKEQSSYGHMANSNSKDAWHSGLGTRNALLDHNSRLADGVGAHYSQSNGDGSGYNKNVIGDPYGFGDPGLGPKNIAKIYTSSLPSMAPRHESNHGVDATGASRNA